MFYVFCFSGNMNAITSFVESLMELFSLTSQMLSLSVRVWSLSITLLLQLLVLLAVHICICWFLIKFVSLHVDYGDNIYGIGIHCTRREQVFMDVRNARCVTESLLGNLALWLDTVH